MGFLEDMFNKLSEFAESEAGQEFMRKAQEAKMRADMEEEFRTTGINGLKIENIEFKSAFGGYGSTYRGWVRNIGKSTYSWVEIEVDFKDGNQKLIDKKYYKVIPSSLGLAPGEKEPFEVSCYHAEATKASSSIINCKEM